jgi:hypothetical protein
LWEGSLHRTGDPHYVPKTNSSPASIITRKRGFHVAFLKKWKVTKTGSSDWVPKGEYRINRIQEMPLDYIFNPDNIKEIAIMDHQTNRKEILYYLIRNTGLIGFIEKLMRQRETEHYFMFGQVYEDKVIGTFIGEADYGNFVAVWVNEITLKFKFTFHSSGLTHYYSVRDVVHEFKPVDKIQINLWPKVDAMADFGDPEKMKMIPNMRYVTSGSGRIEIIEKVTIRPKNTMKKDGCLKEISPECNLVEHYLNIFGLCKLTICPLTNI